MCIRDRDRLKPVPFNVKFRDTQNEVKDLAEKLVQEEGSGILNWMLRGLEEYMEIGLAVPEEAKQKAQELRDEQDFLGRFLDERTARTDANGEMVMVSRLYDTFKMHSDATGEGRGWTRTKFNAEMRAKAVSYTHLFASRLPRCTMPTASPHERFNCGLAMSHWRQLCVIWQMRSWGARRPARRSMVASLK